MYGISRKKQSTRESLTRANEKNIRKKIRKDKYETQPQSSDELEEQLSMQVKQSLRKIKLNDPQLLFLQSKRGEKMLKERLKQIHEQMIVNAERQLLQTKDNQGNYLSYIEKEDNNEEDQKYVNADSSFKMPFRISYNRNQRSSMELKRSQGINNYQKNIGRRSIHSFCEGKIVKNSKTSRKKKSQVFPKFSQKLLQRFEKTKQQWKKNSFLQRNQESPQKNRRFSTLIYEKINRQKTQQQKKQRKSHTLSIQKSFNNKIINIGFVKPKNQQKISRGERQKMNFVNQTYSAININLNNISKKSLKMRQITRKQRNNPSRRNFSINICENTQMNSKSKRQQVDNNVNLTKLNQSLHINQKFLANKDQEEVKNQQKTIINQRAEEDSKKKIKNKDSQKRRNYKRISQNERYYCPSTIPLVSLTPIFVQNRRIIEKIGRIGVTDGLNHRKLQKDFEKHKKVLQIRKKIGIDVSSLLIKSKRKMQQEMQQKTNPNKINLSKSPKKQKN